MLMAMRDKVAREGSVGRLAMTDKQPSPHSITRTKGVPFFAFLLKFLARV